MNGLELQRLLAANRCEIPVIFITAPGDGAARSQALKNSAQITCSSRSAMKRYFMRSTRF
jgi:DNA-binding NarL/FixJ family response regulator